MTPVAMATKSGKTIGYNCASEISLITLHITGDFRGQAIEWCQSNFQTPTLATMATKS